MNRLEKENQEVRVVPKKLLYFCPASFGGIADYGHEQARAIASLGVDVVMLCASDYPHEAQGYKQLRVLSSLTNAKGKSRLISRLNIVRKILADALCLDKEIEEGGFTHVLWATYSEYLAPLWAWRFRKHQQRGIVFAAVVHDPVRDYVVGPRLWHQRSIAEGYSFLREAFVHEAINLDTSRPMPNLKTTVIPHGPFSFPEPTRSRDDFRSRHNIPLDAPVFLSFGHLRDNKNLDLVLAALEKVEGAYLLIAGSEASPAQRQSSEYQQQAEVSHIAYRCRWIIKFLDPEDASNCFNACDVVLLTYSGAFRSASGVLNVAAWFKKPVIASCGESNLGSMVENYTLGKRVLPDDAMLIASAMDNYMTQGFTPQWESYMADHSWEKNAELVIEKLEL